MIFVACVALGGMSHAVAPGWLLLRERGGLHPFKLRVLAGFHALLAALIALVAMLLAMLAAGAVVPLIGLALLAITPPIVAAIAGLGAAWAQAADPRTRLASPPIIRAECLAAGGAILAWVVPGGVWASQVLWSPALAGSSPWWLGVLLGAWAVMLAPMPLNILVVRNLAGAGGLLATAGTVACRAAVCCAALLTATALVVASR